MRRMYGHERIANPQLRTAGLQIRRNKDGTAFCVVHDACRAIRSMFPPASSSPVPYRCSGGRPRNASYGTWRPRCRTSPPSFPSRSMSCSRWWYIPCRRTRSMAACLYSAAYPRYIPFHCSRSNASVRSCHGRGSSGM